MKWTLFEKEIIKAIVKYGDKAQTLADALNESGVLEKYGIAIVSYGDNYVFMSKDLYDWDDKRGLGYVSALHNLIKNLISERYLMPIACEGRRPIVVGKKNARWYKPDIISVDGDKEFISLADRQIDWINRDRQQIYWNTELSEQQLPLQQSLYCSCSVTDDLRELVKRDFKTEEEVRFIKQQRATWIAVIISAILAIIGIIL